MTAQEGIIYRGHYTFIPTRFRRQIVDDSYKTHQVEQARYTALKMVAWWPGMLQCVEWFVSRCEICQKNRPLLGKTNSKEPEADAIKQVHMDSAHIKEQKKKQIGCCWSKKWLNYRRMTELLYLSRRVCQQFVHELEYQKLWQRTRIFEWWVQGMNQVSGNLQIRISDLPPKIKWTSEKSSQDNWTIHE